MFEGNIPVLGSVSDEHLKEWSLRSDSLLIASGTANASGLLGTWNTAALAGFNALVLEAADSVENISRIQIRAFIGEPARLAVLGQGLSKPHGAASGPQGRIYVADAKGPPLALFRVLLQLVWKSTSMAPVEVVKG